MFNLDFSSNSNDKNYSEIRKQKNIYCKNWYQWSMMKKRIEIVKVSVWSAASWISLVVLFKNYTVSWCQLFVYIFCIIYGCFWDVFVNRKMCVCIFILWINDSRAEKVLNFSSRHTPSDKNSICQQIPCKKIICNTCQNVVKIFWKIVLIDVRNANSSLSQFFRQARVVLLMGIQYPPEYCVGI